MQSYNRGGARDLVVILLISVAIIILPSQH
jgi:hypothetical protein